ncbi:hypothetical protein PI125_g24910 [Phytophthora idaei]|nr:hypothetical protein PI125_g24910 [Phytophthora idaei]
MTLQCAKQLHSHMQLDRARNVPTPRDQADVHRHGLENFNDVNSRGVCIKFKEANGHDLAEIATGSMDRYVASLCLQLAPDPDAMLREAKRVLTSDAANKELGLENTAEHSNFIMGRDLPALHQQFAQAGFNHVQICSVPEGLKDRRYAIVKQMANEWLARGTPIGLETYIIVAKASVTIP